MCFFIAIYLLNTLAPGALAVGLSSAVSVPVLTPLNTDGATLPIRSEHRDRHQYVSWENQILKLDERSSISNISSTWLRGQKFLQQLFLFHLQSDSLWKYWDFHVFTVNSVFKCHLISSILIIQLAVFVIVWLKLGKVYILYINI